MGTFTDMLSTVFAGMIWSVVAKCGARLDLDRQAPRRRTS
jgi:hypothetical protein